jgi:hypothetical protein
MNHIPQILTLILFSIDLVIDIRRNKNKTDVIEAFMSFIMVLGLLYWGGFFKGMF